MSSLAGAADAARARGRPDRIAIAIPRGEYQTLPSEGELAWHLDVHVGRGRNGLAQMIGPSHIQQAARYRIG